MNIKTITQNGTDVGDFSHYTSKPLHDFIYESNNGHDVFFTETESNAVTRLLNA